MRVPEGFEPTNYKNSWIFFPLELLLIVQCKGKSKAIPVQTRRSPEVSRP
jgi:hypothetical protein